MKKLTLLLLLSLVALMFAGCKGSWGSQWLGLEPTSTPAPVTTTTPITTTIPKPTLRPVKFDLSTATYSSGKGIEVVSDPWSVRWTSGGVNAGMGACITYKRDGASDFISVSATRWTGWSISGRDISLNGLTDGTAVMIAVGSDKIIVGVSKQQQIFFLQQP